jgi:Tol biopolymer transport system component
VSLTPLHGQEGEPSFSPDGNQVAFTWDGGVPGNSKIYMKFVGSSEVRQLTAGAAFDRAPSWSPDGRQIAFVRFQKETDKAGHIHLMSSLGGPVTKLSDFPTNGQISWSPDGRVVAAARADQGSASDSTAIYVIPTDTGEPRAVTSTRRPAVDLSPAFSPDGTRLAYSSCQSWEDGTCAVYALNLDSGYRQTAPAHRLTSDADYTAGLCWSRDGRSVIYAQRTMAGRFYLFRVPVTGTHIPERIEVAGQGAVRPRAALSQNRLVFARDMSDVDIYQFQVRGSAAPLIVSSLLEYQPQFSPDGRHIAFTTTRSGEGPEIWVAAADGSEARQLTLGSERWQDSPHWSPDGRQIAFNLQDNDRQSHIWTVDVEGGPPRQITKNAGNQNCPTWSRDGQAVYYTEVRGTNKGLWRVAASGGTAVRITRDAGGYLGIETVDGRSVLYQPTLGESPVMMMPLGGGPARQVVTCAQPTAFAVGAQGVYYVDCGSSDDLGVHVVDLSAGRDRLVGRLEGYSAPIPIGLAVSPDGTTILYAKYLSAGSDLMIIENFR